MAYYYDRFEANPVHDAEREESRCAGQRMTEMERVGSLIDALADHSLTVRGYQMAAAEGLGE